jgi:hypothetical protein
LGGSSEKKRDCAAAWVFSVLLLSSFCAQTSFSAALSFSLSLSLPVKNVVVLFLKQKAEDSQKRSFKKNPKTKKLF